jgi:hypothetical protein
MKATRKARALSANTNPTGGDPVVARIFKQVNDAVAKSAAVHARGTRMSPPPGSASPPANMTSRRKGGAA